MRTGFHTPFPNLRKWGKGVARPSFLLAEAIQLKGCHSQERETSKVGGTINSDRLLLIHKFPPM